ncbi:helix-turn-helix transcriptional regulator [Maribacter algarum]|uniref:Helix-turn-helix transcriptional regulator n=1 Tax=Maribacter algarum (ex Zhang et al. 2020) TaxID=2578118 RepID=A0A5S3PI08_9FLAO|nr:AraC family transcriptional regulator [Maribacter algarum]TMM53908.1 helix-turn-helix transcriptional regulator [Maribacter algarum]
MNYWQQVPDLKLKGLVRCYWSLDNDSSQNLNFTILPDGFFDLIVRYSNYKFESISLTGLYTKEVDVQIRQNTQLFGIQFKLAAAETIFQQSIAQLLNDEKLLKNVIWDFNNLSFEETISQTERLNNLISDIAEENYSYDIRKQRLFQILNQTKGNQSIKDIAQDVFWSSRQINRYFKRTFGVPLKVYCNILRCSASYKDIKKGELYSNQNYFDRSHFNKEIKKHTNHTPKNLLKNENDRFLQISIIPKK